MFEIKTTNQFEKEVDLCWKRGYDMHLLYNAMKILSETGSLPASYKPHKLKGKYTGQWEAHLQPDWLLIWRKHNNTLFLTLTATGTHSDLFD